MTRRITIIGSSHCAALRMGWDMLAPDTKDWELTFHALPGKTFRKLQIDDTRSFGMLVPSRITPDLHTEIRSALGGDTIDLTRPDAVISVGWHLHESENARLLAFHSVDGLTRRKDVPRLSRATYDSCLDSLASHAVPGTPWQNWSAPPFFVLPQPRPSISCLDQANPLYASWQAFAAAHSDGAELLKPYLARVAATLARVGVYLLDPPAAALHASGLTMIEYTRGAPKLLSNDTHPETDHHHMNAAYGALAIEAMLQQVDTVLSNV